MPPNAEENAKKLAELIKAKRGISEEFVLLLGAGASIASGSTSWKAIIDDFMRKHSPGRVYPNHSDKINKFYEMIGTWSARERYAHLRNHIEGRGPSIGYLLLADLIKDGFFPLIFTTNWDHHLEDSLLLRNLRTHEFLVRINQGRKDMEGEIRRSLRQKLPVIKILKIYGDLRSGIFAITPQERLRFTKAIEGVLKEYLTDQLVIIGSSLQDIFMTKYIADEGDRMWLVKPSPPKDQSLVEAMEARHSDKNVISGQLGSFDMFFSILADELQISVEEAAKIAESPMIPHLKILEQYREGKRDLVFTDESGEISSVDCHIIDSVPTNVRDVGNHSKLRVHFRIPCVKGKENIEGHFTVGLEDKFSGIEYVECPRNHKFILSKRLTWLMPHPESAPSRNREEN